jgi:hypothetical protein
MHCLDTKVYYLDESQFKLDSESPLSLHHDRYSLILFYNDLQKADRDTLNIWCEVARQIVCIKLATVNVRIEHRIGELLQRTPLIIIYHNGVPMDVYNGQIDVNSLLSYVMGIKI